MAVPHPRHGFSHAGFRVSRATIWATGSSSVLSKLAPSTATEHGTRSVRNEATFGGWRSMGWNHLMSDSFHHSSVDLSSIDAPYNTPFSYSRRMDMGSGTLLLHAWNGHLAKVSLLSPFYLGIRSRLLHGEQLGDPVLVIFCLWRPSAAQLLSATCDARVDMTSCSLGTPIRDSW